MCRQFVVEEAFHVAASGRPGPVLIDLPKNIAAGATTHTRAPIFDNRNSGEDDTNALEHAEMMIAKAKKPLLYVGGGVGIAGAVAELRAFARRTGIPSVATLKGLGADPYRAIRGSLACSACTVRAPPTTPSMNAIS